MSSSGGWGRDSLWVAGAELRQVMGVSVGAVQSHVNNSPFSVNSVITIVAVHLLISLLFPVNCSYLNP